MRFVETPKFADSRAALARLLQIVMTAPRDSTGRVAVARIEKTFRGEGGTISEFAQAMRDAMEEGWLTVDAAGKHVIVTKPGVDKLA